MSLEVIAIALTLVVHFLGAIVLIWAIIGDEQIDWRATLWPRDDDGGGGGPGFEPPRGPDGGPGGGMLAPPLADAAPSPIRLREPGRIADAHPRPARRPAHAPERTPVHEPAGV
ncbi:hypothetical protein [Baekduia sp.]|uniref:hypothetical protein n=1 Tax=Baekduia sp. TaxID=2600305 RepID=UPI002E078F76|nr:hypothetical protein [Baekduia sp.]